MNVLLLSMPDTAPHFNGKRWKAPNLAISSIAGNIKNHNVFIADLVLRRDKIEESVLELLQKYRPSIVGLSAMSFQFDTSRKVAQLIKDENREIKTVLGGYHATLMSDEIADSGCSEPFDFLVRGEGDLSFNELLEAYEQKRDLKSVSGISYKKEGKFIHNSPRPLENLHDIKLPARAKRVYKGYQYYSFALDIIETSRGCTMPCNFCSIDKMYGKSFREYSIERVMQDIGDAKKHGANFIIIADDNFSLNVKRFEDICDAIVDYGHNDIRYIIQASSAGIASSEKLAEKMARAGFRIVFLGIENVSKENLKNLQKGNIIEKTKIAVKKLHDQGIMIVGGMIIGHPNDKEEDIAENYEFFVGLDIDFFADQILTPYPKTPLRKEMIENGLVTNKYDYSRYNCFWANIKTNYLSPDELQFLRWKYNRKYADYICTTRAFIKNYPAAYYYRTYLMRPYRKLKNRIFQKKLTERDLYRLDMKRAEDMNKFF
ncbi:MAG: radical SAM protein [Candidatus Scalindua sp. AMX11]|nr:MAG: radical SAM protein [Candidatus Scalindua sp.]NOG84161.1 radical SAM protein [Planctomycetota bacterium]RZV98932.1 MAG: radical SAM protein [Candidatus Scalindua sp. SCAELEC01]TDE66876.1 MAG: radical SAM protein [Candidatus Scalindua sp. AMX11]GJQ57678.1 MAG: B12-binding domain-containing radical SAM protein [Candidatus Scalindua sp.]